MPWLSAPLSRHHTCVGRIASMKFDGGTIHSISSIASSDSASLSSPPRSQPQRPRARGEPVTAAVATIVAVLTAGSVGLVARQILRDHRRTGMPAVRTRVFQISFPVALATGLAAATAAAQEPVLQFDAVTPITLGSEPVVVSVFSNSPQELRSLSLSASLDPPADRPNESPQSVPARVDTGSGFRTRREELILPAGGRIRVRLVRPAGVRPGATGWLTVTAASSAGVVVARRAISVQSATLKPAVTAWKTTSVDGWPGGDGGGDVGSALPLAVACTGAEGPTGYVAHRDEAIVISSTCTQRALRLRADRYPRPGTYSGKLEVGMTAVDLEVRRTMAVWWPVLMIVLGVVLALWTQGQLDSALRTGQWLAIKRLPRRARKADVAYAERADGTPWENYELEQPVKDAADGLSREHGEIARGLPRPLRWLPWPDGYMADEREAIQTKLAALEQLVRDWPALPDDFSAARDELMKRPHVVEHAPELVARALIVLGAADGPFDADELQSRRDEARALPAALSAVDELLRVRDYLGRFPDPPPDDWATGDQAALVRARQYGRQATAMLAAATDATLVEPEIRPVVERASRLASRLPEPSAPKRRGIGRARPQSAAAPALAPIVSLGRILETVRAGRVAAGPAAVVSLSLAIGVLTGLGALYFGKAWGAPEDYAAALVWGFVASTITSPIVAVVKHLGTRARDAAAPASRG
jgi:hypothetical protein